MDCLRSFTISMDVASTFSGSVVKTWAVGTEVYWAIRQTGNSTFQFQGFKNVDIYGIDVVGGIQTQVGAGIGGVNVTDWNFVFIIDGQLPLPSGFVNTSLPNYWSPQIQGVGAQTFALSKNSNSLKFASPIKSAQILRFEVLNAQGIGAQTLATASLAFDLTFVVYYKYEGE